MKKSPNACTNIFILLLTLGEFAVKMMEWTVIIIGKQEIAYD